MTDRLERLVNLTATLLDTRRPLTLDELAERLEPSYPTELVARRRAFERDKETLRELGIPIRVEPVDAAGGEAGYRIRPEDYYLPEPDLTPEERAALHLAVSAVRLEDDAARAGLHKLGGLEGSEAGLDVTPLAELQPEPALGELFGAVAARRPVAFDYRGEPRRLEPYGVVHRAGHWYVVGRDQDREASRAFRIDRIEGEPELGPPGSFAATDVDPAEFVRADPLTFGDEAPIEARVLVDASRAAWAVDEIGTERVAQRHEDGSVVLTLSVVNRAAFRTWVLGLREHAEVLGPQELREDLAHWLHAIVEANR